MTPLACAVSQLNIGFLNKTPNQSTFQKLQFNLTQQQISACTGRNGLGKSLLIQVLHFQHTSMLPYSGEILWQLPHAYLAQLKRVDENTIAGALGITEMHQAFMRIEAGTASFKDFDLTENQWHLPAQWSAQLTQAKLPDNLNFPVELLSEGQKTKLALCALFLKPDHYLLLDEPSNHLDAESRTWLINSLKAHPAGAFIISHDRALLNQAHHIYALNEYGLQHVSGNYDDYVQQHELQYGALERQTIKQKRELKQLKAKQHETLMKAQKRQRSGKQLRSSNSQAPILLDFKKEQAGQSLSGMQKQQQKQMEEKQMLLHAAQNELEHFKQQQFGFQHHAVKTGEILRIDHLPLPFGTEIPLCFSLKAGDKIHLQGRNGSGKSTLLKLLKQQAQAANLHVHLAVKPMYLDQNFSNLQPEYSVLDNLSLFNPKLPASEWRNQLGQLRIRGDRPEQPLSRLSGGEKLKTALLGLNYWPENIELLLLDEPENHLDIESRELLAQAIAQYTGAVILVSHDTDFVTQCGIDMHWDIESN